MKFPSFIETSFTLQLYHLKISNLNQTNGISLHEHDLKSKFAQIELTEEQLFVLCLTGMWFI